MAWIIEEKESLGDGSRVFSMRAPRESTWAARDVWWTDGRPYCCECSGPLSAMLSSCLHAQALKRHMAKMTPNVKSQATAAALSRQVACTDGLGVAVPPAPTLGETT